MKLKLGSYRVFIVGIIMGLSAAAIQAYFEVQPPVAYGIAFIGHPNNLLTWTTNEFLGTNFPVREAFILLPPLTVIGVFIGSGIAAARSKELRLRPGPVRSRFSAVIFGSSVFMAPGAITNFTRRNLPQEMWAYSISVFTVIFAISQTLGPYIAGLIGDYFDDIGMGLFASFIILILGALVSFSQKELTKHN